MWVLFLIPNHQCQSTEGKMSKRWRQWMQCSEIIITASKTTRTTVLALSSHMLWRPVERVLRWRAEADRSRFMQDRSRFMQQQLKMPCPGGGKVLWSVSKVDMIDHWHWLGSVDEMVSYVVVVCLHVPLSFVSLIDQSLLLTVLWHAVVCR